MPSSAKIAANFPPVTIERIKTMETKHTPGPWAVSDNGFFIMAADGSASIVETGLHKDEEYKPGEPRETMRSVCLANAVLIAEAPALLDCLRRVMRHIPADAGGASLGHDMYLASEANARATRYH